MLYIEVLRYNVMRYTTRLNPRKSHRYVSYYHDVLKRVRQKRTVEERSVNRPARRDNAKRTHTYS